VKTSLAAALLALALPVSLVAQASDRDHDLGHFTIASSIGVADLEDSDGTFSVVTSTTSTSTPCSSLLGLLPGPLGCDITVADFLILFPSGTTTTPGGVATAPYRIDFASATAFDATLGYDFTGPLRMDLMFAYFKSDLNSVNATGVSGEMESHQLFPHLWLDFNEDGIIQPYIGLGVGATYIEVDDLDDTILVGEVGAGVSFALTSHLKLDLSLRYFQGQDIEFDSGSSTTTIEYAGQRASLGLRYDFLTDPPPEPDDDRDGVKNSKDRCPGTPPGVVVDPRGCELDGDQDGVGDSKDKCPQTPPNTPVNAMGCALDSDADGVPDNRDACPGTPPGVAVDARGCPLVRDDDGDGVPNPKDRCPNTPSGQPVLTNGCAPQQSLILKGVNFHSDSDVLTYNARNICLAVAETLRSSPDFMVALEGHTDSTNTDAHNLDLSQRRAESLRRCLISEGVEANRLIARGFGESRPIASNNTEDGKAANRRVELKVLRQQ